MDVFFTWSFSINFYVSNSSYIEVEIYLFFFVTTEFLIVSLIYVIGFSPLGTKKQGNESSEIAIKTKENIRLYISYCVWFSLGDSFYTNQWFRQIIECRFSIHTNHMTKISRRREIVCCVHPIITITCKGKKR